MIEHGEFIRLSPKGKRRAVIAQIVGGFVGAFILFAAGYLACALCCGLQVLAGVR